MTTLQDLGNKFPPARGLKKLTWAQVEAIDEIIHLMSEVSRENGSEISVSITVRNGHPREITHPLITRNLKPVP